MPNGTLVQLAVWCAAGLLVCAMADSSTDGTVLARGQSDGSAIVMESSELCPRGYRADTNGSKKRCYRCRAGLFDDRDVDSDVDSDSRSCTLCGIDDPEHHEYQDEDGQTTCKVCADHSVANHEKTGCECIKGYWAPSASKSDVCKPCPTNGACDGKLELPRALPVRITHTPMQATAPLPGCAARLGRRGFAGVLGFV